MSEPRKGKEKAIEELPDFEHITPEYLDSLLDRARKNARSTQEQTDATEEEDVIELEKNRPLPRLRPKNLPAGYLNIGSSANKRLSLLRDPEVERVEKASASLGVPQPPIPPPELSKSGKPLTKKEKKALRTKTAGPDWFDLPAPDEADIPRLYREVEALRLRNQLDPKRFYRKDEGEGKGIKGLPKYFAIGTVVTTPTPFGTASTDNLARAKRKRTIVDELVDDAEARHYAKKKFEELQTVRAANGRGTWAKKRALRKRKW